MTPSRRCLARVALLLVSVSLCLLLLEGAVRVFLGSRIVLYPRFHAKAIYGKYTLRRLRPNATFRHRNAYASWDFTVNSNGFRSATHVSYVKPPGVFRVLCVGDSHTQGFECSQDRTYAAVMQRYLRAHGMRAEVINAGVSGFSTAEALAFTEGEGMRYSPDVVVLGFFANDIDDNVKADLFRLSGGRLVEHRFDHTPAVRALDLVDRFALLRWLGQHSFAYSHAFNTIWEFRKGLLFTEAERHWSQESAVAQTDRNPDLTAAKHRLAAALVSRLHAVCASRNVRLVVLDVPQMAGGPSGFRPSVPSNLVEVFRTNSDALVMSTQVLAEYGKAMDVFVPYGQRHISETTHMLLGVAAAKAAVARETIPP